MQGEATGGPDEPASSPSSTAATRVREPALLVAALGAILFLAILVDVQARGALATQVDPWVRERLGFDAGPLYETAAVVTHLGNGWPLAAVSVVSVYLPLRRGRRWEAVTIATSAVGIAVTVQLAKWLAQRPRPGDPSSWDAFPSGHAAWGLAAWGLLLLLAFPGGLRDRRAWAAFLAVAFACGVTRILIDVHWTTDVVAGWSLGAAWLAATIAARDRLLIAYEAGIAWPGMGRDAP